MKRRLYLRDPTKSVPRTTLWRLKRQQRQESQPPSSDTPDNSTSASNGKFNAVARVPVMEWTGTHIVHVIWVGLGRN